MLASSTTYTDAINMHCIMTRNHELLITAEHERARTILLDASVKKHRKYHFRQARVCFNVCFSLATRFRSVSWIYCVQLPVRFCISSLDTVRQSAECVRFVCVVGTAQ